MKRSVVIVGLLAGLTGCGANGKSSDQNASAAATARTLTLRDQAGAVVLRGTLALPALPPARKTIEGTWTIATQAESFPRSATAGRMFVAERLEDGRVRIDLSPRMRDNNVVLTGTPAGDTLRGQWAHLTIAGPRAGGAFELVPAKE